MKWLVQEEDGKITRDLVDICMICESPYEVRVAHQKFCPECSEKMQDGNFRRRLKIENMKRAAEDNADWLIGKFGYEKTVGELIEYWEKSC